MLTSTRSPSIRYHVATETGWPSDRTDVITAGFGSCSIASASGVRGALGMSSPGRGRDHLHCATLVRRGGRQVRLGYAGDRPGSSAAADRPGAGDGRTAAPDKPFAVRRGDAPVRKGPDDLDE